MNNKIWCLFSIQNEYDQPNNNLECWWQEKPSFEGLAVGLCLDVDIAKGDSRVGKVLKGEKVRIGYSDYRLQEVEEKEILDN